MIELTNDDALTAIEGLARLADNEAADGASGQPWRALADRLSVLVGVADPDVKVWTFFGHWGDDDRLVIDAVIEGEHQDERTDDGTYAGGLWAASGSGTNVAEVQAEVVREYEDDDAEGRARDEELFTQRMG